VGGDLPQQAKASEESRGLWAELGRDYDYAVCSIQLSKYEVPNTLTTPQHRGTKTAGL